ncbi:MAG: hypothetical protein AAGA44_07125 [Pseudomonadota bacterium]
MDRRSLQHLLAAAALAVLAGCSSSSDDPAPADPVVTPPPPPPVNAPQSAAPGATSVTDIGEVFAKEADGFTLYTFENDRDDVDGDGAGDSDCNGGCADNWPPLLADATSEATGAFSIITRDDGTSLQWAFKGLPLYTFAGDANAGETNGDGNGDVWYVARPDPWMRGDVDASAKGTVFVGRGSVRGVDGSGGIADTRDEREGFTLYTFENDRNDTDGDGNGDSDCNAGCAETWPPLYADPGATEGGPFTIVTRDDGTRQWALLGLPLYFFAPDLAPGDTEGEGAGNVWYVARPAPFEAGDSALGPIVVAATSTRGLDASGAPTFERAELTGFSLYVFDNDVNDASGDGAGDSDCNGGCAQTWPPLFVDAGATEFGRYTIIERDDGARQWAINGEPMYFFASDFAAGDVNGDQAGNVWHLARRAPVQIVTDANEGDIFEARGVIAEVDGNGDRAETSSLRTGFTLYRFDNDRTDAEGDGAGDSDCNGGCAVTWPPLFANEADSAVGDFGIIDREDGSRQWTYQGDPLYFFSGDQSPEDVNGVYGTWFTVSPSETQDVSQGSGY